MAQFQNTTLHPIPIMINGVRKTIRPGEQFHGPDNLSSIQGLTEINRVNKPILIKPQSNAQLTPNNITNIMTPQLSNNDNLNALTDSSNYINDELSYLEYMKSLGESPSVSIAILTKNRLDLITNCCNSIFDQVKYKNVTLTIIDTGTTETNVREFYKTLEPKCNERNWKYQFIQLDSYHYSKNYNTAIRNHIKTEYVLIQNNDTVALNDYVSEMMNTALMKKAGSVGCRMYYPDKVSIQHDGQTIFNAPNEQFGSASHLNLRSRRETIKDNYTYLVDGNTAAGVLMRTSDYLKINGFDEQFGDIFQDVHMMIKVPQVLNKFNYCNRIANIIHIDNASRLQTGADQKKHIQMWDDTHYLRKQLIENRWMKMKRPKTYDFSIITSVYNLDSYKEFAEGLKLQQGNVSFEILPIPNFYNHFQSAYKALNSASDIASGNILIYCHDDITIQRDWLLKIKTRIQEIESVNKAIGVLGPAGITFKEESAFYLLSENSIPLNKLEISVTQEKNFIEVQTLDELCLITLKRNNLRFDDNLMTGWHFYGANLCLKAIQQGLHNWAIDCYCYHKSDGYKNISSLEKWNIFEECAKRLDIWAKSVGITQWRTTTAKSIINTLQLFPKKPNA